MILKSRQFLGRSCSFTWTPYSRKTQHYTSRAITLMAGKRSWSWGCWSLLATRGSWQYGVWHGVHGRLVSPLPSGERASCMIISNLIVPCKDKPCSNFHGWTAHIESYRSFLAYSGTRSQNPAPLANNKWSTCDQLRATLTFCSISIFAISSRDWPYACGRSYPHAGLCSWTRWSSGVLPGRPGTV